MKTALYWVGKGALSSKVGSIRTRTDIKLWPRNITVTTRTDIKSGQITI